MPNTAMFPTPARTSEGLPSEYFSSVSSAVPPPGALRASMSAALSYLEPTFVEPRIPEAWWVYVGGLVKMMGLSLRLQRRKQSDSRGFGDFVSAPVPLRVHVCAYVSLWASPCVYVCACVCDGTSA